MDQIDTASVMLLVLKTISKSPTHMAFAAAIVDDFREKLDRQSQSDPETFRAAKSFENNVAEILKIKAESERRRQQRQ